MHRFEIYLERADEDTPRKLLGEVTADTMAQALQAVMLAEIALQLAKQNEVLEQIVKQLRVGIVVEQA